MLLRGAVLGLMLAASASTASAQQRLSVTPPCPAERAIYTIPDSEARLRLMRPTHGVNAFSDLALRVEAAGHVLWFGFVSSNGYGRDFIVYINDPTAPDGESPYEVARAPEGDEVGVFDSDMSYRAIPRADEPAPIYIYAPGIGPRFWYDLPERTHVPVGMWRLTECATR